MLYVIAKKICSIARWIWGVLIITILVSGVSSLALMQVTDIPHTAFVGVIHWFMQFQFIQWLLMSLFVLSLVVTLVAYILSIIEGHMLGGQALKKYLRSVKDENMGLSPAGIYQQSQVLISVNVSLEDNFIHLHTMPDRPRNDLPEEQQRLLEELRQRSDLSVEEREERIQRLRGVWWHIEQEPRTASRPNQRVRIEGTLQRLTATNPVAVLLGAPGSGKSTSLRWLALQMSKASLSAAYKLPKELINKQIPILLHVSEFARYLTESADATFEQFLQTWAKRKHPDLPARLSDALEQGLCLVLLDGLDEVASDNLRRRIARSIQSFVTQYTADKVKTRHYNRFIITSRIVGYEEGPFSAYTHYTLLDLTNEQIEGFLNVWCLEVEHHMTRSGNRGRDMTTRQKEQADIAGRDQRDRLLNVLKNNLSIKRLAVNPLMLTILALIQRSGKILPQRRIDLYQVVTLTLLDNWNQESGRKVLDDVKLAEQTLSNLAYYLHNNDYLMTTQDVKKIVHQSMATHYERLSETIEESAIDQFVETVRRSSGLFVESGQGLFSFMHRTFQEYYAAQYLLHSLSSEELLVFVGERFHQSIWHEPLLLAIAQKSGQDRQAATNLIQAIKNTEDCYDGVLHNNLLFAASCLVDCGAWSISKNLQEDIARDIFALYGDNLGKGRYTALKQALEQVTLLWIGGQPQTSMSLSPLLAAWRTALSDAQLQIGATHLLAAIAPNLQHCSSSILDALIPPLIQLANITDIAAVCQPSLLDSLDVRPASLMVEEYAFIALRLLGSRGPAGWLHEAWRKWSKERPELLERLTQHALELGYLLTPAALPDDPDHPDWEKQKEISDNWQKKGRRYARELQEQLLQGSAMARFPHAYLYWKMLQAESSAPQGTPWQETWNNVLRKEIEQARSVTYQACLQLQLLIYKGSDYQLQKIADQLQSGIIQPGRKQLLTLSAIANLYIRDFRDLRDLRYLRDLKYFRYFRDLKSPREIRYFRYLRDFSYIRDFCYLRDFIDLIDLRDFIDLRDLRDLRDFMELRDLRDLRYFRDIRYLINPKREEILQFICDLLTQIDGASYIEILFTLYSIIASDTVYSPETKQQVHNAFYTYRQNTHMSTGGDHLLINAIERRMGTSPVPMLPLPQMTADERATMLDGLKKHDQLGPTEIEALLIACTDTRELSKSKWQELVREEHNAGTVGEVAWRLLLQPFLLQPAAIDSVVQALEHRDAIICAAAALLLRRCKQASDEKRQEAGQKIIEILADDELSHRPLEPPDFSEIWRLDDVLFETLQQLAQTSTT